MFCCVFKKTNNFLKDSDIRISVNPPSLSRFVPFCPTFCKTLPPCLSRTSFMYGPLVLETFNLFNSWKCLNIELDGIFPTFLCFLPWFMIFQYAPGLEVFNNFNFSLFSLSYLRFSFLNRLLCFFASFLVVFYFVLVLTFSLFYNSLLSLYRLH